ncbi:MAG: FAD-binding protein [Coriobacteriia bacterium]|nr:FAD-binding protein [Coriobacteriia bacterium]
MKDSENLNEKSTMLSRRSFLTGAAAVTAVAATAGLVGCSTKNPSWIPAKWDAEADFVVVGYGAAGAAAAITAKKENLGSVIVLDAAPEGQEGGNTRVCAQLMFIPDNAKDAATYQTALNGRYVVEPELVTAWSEAIVENLPWMKGLGADMKTIAAFSPEFQNIAGGTSVKVYDVGGVMGMSSLWNFLKSQEKTLGFQVMYSTRGTDLVRDPDTNEALGVIADQNGTKVYIKAKKGVVLSCGGFENNPKMLADNIMSGYPEIHPFGTPYNKGDGFQMVGPFGAKLWHMNNISGNGLGGLAAGKDNNSISFQSFGQVPLKDNIFVGPNGKRFMYEEAYTVNRHGKIDFGGTYINLPLPTPAYVIFGSMSFANIPVLPPVATGIGWMSTIGGFLADTKATAAVANKTYLDAGVFQTAATVEELAKKIGIDPTALAATVKTYNGYVANQKDPDFHRGEAVYDTFSGMNATGSVATTTPTAVIKPFALQPITGPFYAMELKYGILNTQGGPKRSAKGEIVDTSGNPIKRLYGAGEFGCIYPFLYNGGGNVSEALASGRLAVRSASALAAWDAKK